MRKALAIFFILIAISCQKVTIDRQKYLISPSTTELGCIGLSSSLIGVDNKFIPYSYPLLKTKIRLDVKFHPFNKQVYKSYKEKSSGSSLKINYSDSLAVKPEFITINILDREGLVSEYNNDYNSKISSHLQKTGKEIVITGIAIALPSSEMAKVKQADAYYLINPIDSKYAIQLYKDGKKTDTVDLNTGIVLSYYLESFCWSSDKRGKWYIAGLVEKGKNCEGNTLNKIKEKNHTANIYKL